MAKTDDESLKPFSLLREEDIKIQRRAGKELMTTQYGIIDKDSHDRGFVIGGKDRVTNQDMMKCCWPAYLTVMILLSHA